MKSTLKIALPIVILMGVIFGVTLLSVYTPKPPEKEEGEKIVGPGGAEPPLRFFTSSRSWDPPSFAPEFRNFPLLAPSGDPSKAESPESFSVQDRIFQGFYEPSPDVRRTQFWFENRNPQSVTMQLKGVSCTACSGGRVAAIPPEVTKQYLHRTALASLPIGPFNAFGVGLADPAASLSELQWSQAAFKDDPNATFKVPAAANADKWSPQWGILELTFTVSKNPTVPLRAGFAMQVDGTQQAGTAMFAIMFASAEPCEVSRPALNFGDFEQLSGDREQTFLVYSSTRGPGSEFGDLAVPACVIQSAPGANDSGKFVEVTKVARVPEVELLDVGQELSKQGRITRVRAAYRVTVAVRPKVGDARLDIGLMESTLHLTVGPSTHSVKLTARVRGTVWLAGNHTDIEIPTFKTRTGTVHTVGLVTERAGMELAVVESDCKPSFFKYELAKQEDHGGQGHYTLKITVPEGRQPGGAIDRDAVAVLEVKPHPIVQAAGTLASRAAGTDVKGPNPQRIRIPVNGKAER